MKISELKQVVDCITISEGADQNILAIYDDSRDYSSLPDNRKLFGALCVCPSGQEKLGDYKSIQYVKTDKYGESTLVSHHSREELIQKIRALKK